MRPARAGGIPATGGSAGWPDRVSPDGCGEPVSTINGMCKCAVGRWAGARLMVLGIRPVAGRVRLGFRAGPRRSTEARRQGRRCPVAERGQDPGDASATEWAIQQLTSELAALRELNLRRGELISRTLREARAP